MKMSRYVIHALYVFGLWLGLGLQAHGQTRTVHYYYTDPQGTPLVKTDAQGNVIARYDYTPYGNAVTSLGSPPDGPGYTGHVNDPETGLVYMQQRYYQPDGRFLSPDAVRPVPGNIYSFNRYAYASNNPIINIDPDGRKSTDDPCMGNMACESNESDGRNSSYDIIQASPSSGVTINNKNKVDPAVAAKATREANQALVEAFKEIFKTTDGAQMAFAAVVQPIADALDTEIGAKIFDVGPGYRLGGAVSDGVICSSSAICSVNIYAAPDISGGVFAGYTHTHPNNLGLSGSDLYVLRDLENQSNSFEHVTVYASGPNGRSNKWTTDAMKTSPQQTWSDYEKRTSTWIP